MKLKSFVFLFFLAGTFFMYACTSTSPVEKDLDTGKLIPIPSEVIPGEGYAFQINDKTSLLYTGEELAAEGELAAEVIREHTGISLTPGVGVNPRTGILLLLDPELSDLGQEGYQIIIDEAQMRIEATTPAGIFYGIQTLNQMLPDAGTELESGETVYALGAGTIRDVPRYGYRGSMLDVARHFFPPETVKRYIDYLARYKMNVLHLHLTDDQGWRIEIKSWPKLTEIGGQTEVGGGEGGFYTQEEYRDLVAYAAERYMTIVPEIDMPGHTNAALASYPELNCDGKATELYTGTEVGFSTLCTDKEEVYQFVDDVLRELAGMTPGPYLHIGGDESHVTEEPDYIYFVDRVEEIVKKYDKKMIGWDEITLADLEEGAIAQYWASPKNAKAAREKNIPLIISPAKYAYLDMKYDDQTELGLSWASYIEVDHAYNWNPADLEDGITDEHILGVEAPLWGETIEDLDDIEFLLFPRLPGYAEIGWSPQEKRNWSDFRQRLAEQADWFEEMDINYYVSPKVPFEVLD